MNFDMSERVGLLRFVINFMRFGGIKLKSFRQEGCCEIDSAAKKIQ